MPEDRGVGLGCAEFLGRHQFVDERGHAERRELLFLLGDGVVGDDGNPRMRLDRAQQRVRSRQRRAGCPCSFAGGGRKSPRLRCARQGEPASA
jgi:hypothetical protein